MKLMNNNRGQALAETAIVMTVFMLLLLGMFDLFHAESAAFDGHIRARNKAWKAGANESSLFEIFSKAGNAGDAASMADMLLQTSHAKVGSTLDLRYILPDLKISNNVYVDRNTWSFNIGIMDIRDFFKRSPVGPDGLKNADFEE